MTTESASFDVDLMKTAQLGDAILTELDRLRELDPVHWSAASHSWLITRHEDVAKGFSGELPLSVYNRLASIQFTQIPAEERERRIPTLLKYVSKWIVETDPPEHTRLRKLLLKAFSKKVVEAVRPYVRERVALLLDKAERERELEFVEGIARQLPGGVILKLLGLPEENIGRLKGWANAFQIGLASSCPKPEWLEMADRAMAEMNELFCSEIAKRRSSPQEDLLTALLHATEAGDTLSEDEMLGALSLLLVAGHDTTSNSMTLGILALSRSPQSWAYMRAHPERTLDCVNEIMRLSAMSAAEPRLALEDFEWHGKRIRKGEPVMLMQAAGNRDPRVYTDAGRLDFERDNDRVLTFGPGVHHCIGHLLAKMQMSEFFGALVQRFEAVEVLDKTLDFMPQIVFRGLFALNLRFLPRAAESL
jgi:pimeloyl-[acyl-carrier protein] synthase